MLFTIVADIPTVIPLTYAEATSRLARATCFLAQVFLV